MIFAIVHLLAFPAYAQEATTRDEQIVVPYETTVTACNGEQVLLSGELLLMSRTSIDARGGIHASFTLIPQQVRGIGAETGTQYHATGGERTHFYADADVAPLIYTNTVTLNIISQGGTDNLYVKSALHGTINPDREETAFVNNFSATCSG